MIPSSARPRVAGIYCRVSTTRQEHGRASQLRTCTEFLERRNIPAERIEVYEEQASGRHPNRPVLQRLLHDVALHKVQVVVTFRLDRLSRGGIGDMFRLVQDIEGHGGRLYSATEEWFDPDSPTHELILAILAWAGAFESQATGARVSAGIARRRAQAERRGEPFLWGRALTSPLRRDPQLPAKALELRQAGRSWTETAKALGVGRTTARRLCQMGRASRVSGTAVPRRTSTTEKRRRPPRESEGSP